MWVAIRILLPSHDLIIGIGQRALPQYAINIPQSKCFIELSQAVKDPGTHVPKVYGNLPFQPPRPANALRNVGRHNLHGSEPTFGSSFLHMSRPLLPARPGTSLGLDDSALTAIHWVAC